MEARAVSDDQYLSATKSIEIKVEDFNYNVLKFLKYFHRRFSNSK